MCAIFHTVNTGYLKKKIQWLADKLWDTKNPYAEAYGFQFGVADGARTHDNRNHNPGLYQLSYSHHKTFMARPTGIEPVTARLEGGCSIRLSYGRSTYPVVHNFSENFGRGGGIRTHDPLLPKQMR